MHKLRFACEAVSYYLDREVGAERHIVWNLWIPCLNLGFSVKRMLIDPYFLQGGEGKLD